MRDQTNAVLIAMHPWLPVDQWRALNLNPTPSTLATPLKPTPPKPGLLGRLLARLFGR
jgi:hypothetical protein